MTRNIGRGEKFDVKCDLFLQIQLLYSDAHREKSGALSLEKVSVSGCQESPGLNYRSGTGLTLETDSRSKASELKACSISLLFWAINPCGVIEPVEGEGFERGWVSLYQPSHHSHRLPDALIYQASVHCSHSIFLSLEYPAKPRQIQSSQILP